jgi:hypothetical protein
MAEDNGRKPEDDDAEDQDDGADDTDDQDDEDKPPSDWAARLKKANDDAKKWRMRASGKDPKWTSGGGDGTKPDAKKTESGDTPSADEIRAAARAELEAEYAQKAEQNSLRGAVALALTTAGLALSDEEMKNPASARNAVSRVVNMVKLDSLTLDRESGEVEGLDDEIADLRKSYPGLFRSGKPSNTRGGDAAPRKGGSSKISAEPELEAMAKSWFGS